MVSSYKNLKLGTNMIAHQLFDKKAHKEPITIDNFIIDTVIIIIRVYNIIFITTGNCLLLIIETKFLY